MSAAGRPLRVLVVGPPLSASGGIGRVMSYALAALDPADVQYGVLDTRGLGRNPRSSLLPLLRSCLAVLWLGARHQVDVVHVNVSSHGSAFRKGLVVRVCRLARLPVVLHLHASSFPEFFEPLPGLLQGWVRTTFRLATRVVVLGEFWRAYVEDTLRVRPESVSVLPNATRAVVPGASARTPGEPLHILFLGRLGPRKGVPELLHALADPRLRERPWRATLAGDGDLDTYRARAGELGLESRVAFPGWVDPDSVAEFLADAHVLTLPSYAEGMPISVLESCAAGVPVVCTPVGSVPEVVLDGVNGLLVPVGDAPALASALLRLLDDESLRVSLGAEALVTWRRDHSIGQYVRRLTQEWRTAAGSAVASHDVEPVSSPARG